MIALALAGLASLLLRLSAAAALAGPPLLVAWLSF